MKELTSLMVMHGFNPFQPSSRNLILYLIFLHYHVFHHHHSSHSLTPSLLHSPSLSLSLSTSTAVLVGLPYPNRHQPDLAARLTFARQRVGAAFAQSLYEDLCMRAVNQAIGVFTMHTN